MQLSRNLPVDNMYTTSKVLRNYLSFWWNYLCYNFLADLVAIRDVYPKSSTFKEAMKQICLNLWSGVCLQMAWQQRVPDTICVPQCTIRNRNVHISVQNGTLWDMKQVHCGSCEISLWCQKHTVLLIMWNVNIYLVFKNNVWNGLHKI